jgi:hypothetical protein
MSTTMLGAVNDSFKKFLKDEFSSPPTVKTNPVFMNDEARMESSGLRKFHGRSYISVIYFYLSEKHAQKEQICGSIILYLREGVAYQLIKAMGFVTQNEKITEEGLADMCGELCNMLVGAFKNDVSNLGYKDLYMSAPEKYIDMVPQGVRLFDKNQKLYQEFSFYLWDVRAIVVDVVLADVPRK